MHPKFEIQIFTGQHDRQHSEISLRAMLHALAVINLDWLRRNPHVPPLYRSGVIYRPEDGTEDWQDIPTTLKKGYGDCEDLASWRIAELIHRHHIKAKPFIRYRMIGNHSRYHVMVRLPNGRIEDPSRILGMGVE